MPVILHIDIGFPEAEVLALLIDLPGDFVRLALNHILQIQQRSLSESEVAQAESVLIIIELPPDEAGTELDVVSALSPGERTLFLKHVVDVADRHEPVVTER